MSDTNWDHNKPFKVLKSSHTAPSTYHTPEKPVQTKPLITTEAGIAVRDHLKKPKHYHCNQHILLFLHQISAYPVPNNLQLYSSEQSSDQSTFQACLNPSNEIQKQKMGTNSNVKKFCLNIKTHPFLLCDQTLAQVAQGSCGAFNCGNIESPATATAHSNLPGCTWLSWRWAQ